MTKIKRLFLFFFILTMFLHSFIFIAAQVSGEQKFNHVISNSEDWKDVYSAIHYANLLGVESDFLVSTGHGTIMLNEITKDKKIRVISSSKKPYVINYVGLIESRDFEDADEIEDENINLRLAKELENVDNFIIVDDSYGFNAMAVAPYAVLTNSWVFFANNINIFEIDAVLSQKNPKKVVIYGYVDREVRDALAKYNPEIIDKGDRFQNNIEIVKKYREIESVKQVVLSNGEFIEKEIMKGGEPVLFTGRENVPDEIRDYLKDSDIEIGVLIGNDLVGAATNIRRTTGLNVIVKFARGSRGQTSGVSAIEGLDLFPVPTPTVSLSLHSIKYNKANSQLELTYKSDSNIPIYFKGTVTVIPENGETTRMGDLESIFIAPGSFKTIIYPLESIPSESLEAEIYTLYGETSSSLDLILQGKTKIDIVDIIDKCKFNEENIKSVSYNKQEGGFNIKIKNLEDSECWVDLELKDILIDNSKTTLGSEPTLMIPSKKTKSITIKESLNDDDIEKNPKVDIIVYSGEKEDSLVHTFKGNFNLRINNLSIITYSIIIVIIVIILLAIVIVIVRRRERDDY